MTWRDQAACAGMADQGFAEHDPFHPKHDGAASDYELARKICRRCPVRVECLEDALATEVASARVGMRGGMTPAQRASLWRSRTRKSGTPQMRIDALREECHARGMSDREASEYLGIDPSSFRKWRDRRGLAANYSADGSGQRVTA